MENGPCRQDMIYEYTKVWKRTQPIAINGKIKATEITDTDFLQIAKEYGIKRGQHIIDEIKASILDFEKLARKYKLPDNKFYAIKNIFRI
jgi:hypothetical protein